MSLVPGSLPSEIPTTSESPSRSRRLKWLCTGLFGALLIAGVPALSISGANISNLADTDDPKALRSIAFKAYLDKNPDEALGFYQKAVNSAIKSYGADSTFVADLYYEMGALSLESGKFQTAQGWLQKAVAQNPNSVMARVKLAELLRVRECHTEALAQIQAALKKNPRSVEARHALVLWLIDRKNSAAAIKEAYSLEQLNKPGAAKDTRVASANVPPPNIPQEQKPAAEPQPKPEPPAKPGQLPVFAFLRGAAKKPAVTPAPEPKPAPKPVEAAPPAKHAAPAKHAEPPKPAKPAEPKHNKHSKDKPKEKEKERKPVHQAAPPAEEVTALKAVPETLNSTLKTSAKQVKAAKPAPAAKPQPSENETPESAPPEQPAPTAAIAPPPVVHAEPHKGHPKPTLVPPPPPTTVYFPPPQMMAPPPRPKPAAAAAKPKPKEAPKEAKEPAAEAPEKPVASGGNSDDASFMLQWADVKSKRKPGAK